MRITVMETVAALASRHSHWPRLMLSLPLPHNLRSTSVMPRSHMPMST